MRQIRHLPDQRSADSIPSLRGALGQAPCWQPASRTHGRRIRGASAPDMKSTHSAAAIYGWKALDSTLARVMLQRRREICEPAYGSRLDHRRHLGTRRVWDTDPRRGRGTRQSPHPARARRPAVAAGRASAGARILFAAVAAGRAPTGTRIPLDASAARRSSPLPGARRTRDTAVRRRNGPGAAKPA